MRYSLMTLGNTVPVIFENIQQGKRPPLTVLENLLAAAKANGIEAVDLTKLEIEVYGKETLKRLLDQYELKLGALINFSSVANPDFQGDMVKEAEEAADLTKYFGGRIMMIVPALVGVDIRQSRAEMRSLIIKNLKVYAKVCKEEEIIPVIEDTPDLKIPLCRMKELDTVYAEEKDLFMVYDSGNMKLVQEDEIAYFRHFQERIRHIHLKDMQVCSPSVPFAEYSEEGIPYHSVQQGTGIVDFPGIYKCIKESGYDGYLVIEYADFPLDLEGHTKKLGEIMSYLNLL